MLEPIDDQYQQVGHIARSHGVKGEVLILSDLKAPQLFDEIDLVHIQNARGDLVPARIESVRVQQKNNRLSFFVKFEHVDDRNEAESIKSFSVYVPREKLASIEESDETIDLTSFQVMDDQDNKIGTVSGVIENPAHLILQVEADEEEGKDLLIPFVDEYVVSVDQDSETIVCHNLEQLNSL